VRFVSSCLAASMEIEGTTNAAADAVLPEESPDVMASTNTRARQVFECPYSGCGRSFGKSSKLDRHLVSHTGEVLDLLSRWISLLLLNLLLTPSSSLLPTLLVALLVIV